MAAVNAVGRAAGLEPLAPVRDERAGDLYERHYHRVYAYCHSRLGRREDAEDAVQTTFLHAVNGLRRGVTPGHELAWLLGIARNVCLTRLESAGRRRRLELVCDPVDLERSEAPRSRRDELIGLEHALARLPEQQRRAVLLRDWRGLSYEEVAAQLGVSLANAETLIFRGRRTLAELLQEEPSATRRRLASIGNVGSLFTWAKAGFTGAAAASKLAAAIAVVAVSGAGIAVGAGAVDREREPTARTPAKPAAGATTPERARPTETPSNAASQGSSAPSARSRGAAKPLQPSDRAVPQAPAAPLPASNAASQAPPPASAPAAAKPAPTAPVRTAVDSVVRDVETTVPQLTPVVEQVVSPVVEPVVEAVESVLVPAVAEALTPVVETVVDVVPPVTPPLPVTPVSVDPLTPLP